MKILFASSTINENGGGISSYAIDFITGYRDVHDFLVISDDKPNNEQRQFLSRHIQFSSTGFSYINSLKFLSIVESFKPDVIINSNFPLLSVLVAFIDNRIIKISISHFVDGKLAIIAGFNHQYYDSIITLSKEGSNSIKKYYPRINLDKVKVVYNSYRPTNLNKKKIHRNTPLEIVFPGGAGLHKNPLLVYNTLRGLLSLNHNFKFYWLGNTLLPGWRLFGKKYISDLFKADKRIIFTGNLPRAHAVEIIQNADIFLLPSKKEGCPITLLEAMSAGTIPIVSNAKHASSELILHGINGFVLSKQNPQEFISLINEIIDQPSKFDHIVTESLNTFKKDLTFEYWKERMNLILKQKTNNNRISKISMHNFFIEMLNLKTRLLLERSFILFRSFYYFLMFRFRIVALIKLNSK